MDKNNLLRIYDEAYAQKYNQKFIFSDCHADFEEETIDNLLDEIGEEAKWLDVACGTGYFLSRFPNVERAGLDISPAMLKVAKRANPGVLFVEGDFRKERQHWEGQWDLVSCMWWAYSYVESLSEIEKVIENLANWTSERGICFLPLGNPEVVTVGAVDLPHTIENIDIYGGRIKLEGVIWSWIDEESEKQHLYLLAPQLDYIVSLLQKYFDCIEIIEYPSYKIRKAIIARSKKREKIPEVERDRIQARELSALFFKTIRADNWWLYKIPPLFAVAYAEVLLLDLPFTQAIVIVLALVFISVCAAGYGHVINDIFDVEVDQQVGKHNSMARFSPWQRALFCLALTGLGFSLPVLMNFGTLALSLLGINYLLPTLYSAPPCRFKEKGIFGILSDAAGAHAIPTLFIATTFAHLVATPPLQVTGLAIAATAWSFFAGIRGILLHQLWDRDDDLRSGVKTFVTESNVENVRLWMSRFIFPIELLLLGSLILVIGHATPLILVFTIGYFLLKITLFKVNPTATFDPAPAQKAYVIPHDFYEVGLPLILATVLSLQNTWFTILLLLQVTLFYPGIERRVTNLVQSLRGKPQDLNPLQAQLTASQTELAQLNSRLQQTQNQLEQAQTQLQLLQTETQHDRAQTQTELAHLKEEVAQAEAARQASQAEALRLKLYLQTQGLDGLMNYYRHAIATNPDDLPLYYQALEIQPNDAHIHLQLGNALVRQGQLSEAIARYQIALQYHPDNIEVQLELGKTLEQAKQWDDAIAAYQRAIDLNPDHALAHQLLGNALAERGQIHEASISYRRSLQLQSSH